MKKIIDECYKEEVVRKHKYTFMLEKGDIIKIGGIPCEYLGEDLLSTETNLEL